MKICHVSYDDVANPWLGGGGAVRAREIYRRLTDRHEITFITGMFPQAERDGWVDGMRFCRVGSATSYRRSRLSYCREAIGALAQLQCDVWVYEFSAFAPLRVPVALRRKAVLLFQHIMGFEALRKRPIAGLVALYAERTVIQSYPRIITVSPSLQQRVQSQLKSRIARVHCLYNGVDARYFASPSTPQSRGSDILYFGRLDIHTKGLDLLIEAFSKIAAAYPSTDLLVAGRGADDQVRDLNERIRRSGLGERLKLRVGVSEEEKVDLMAHAMFLCMPSRYEGWGMVAVEAAAAGAAVLGTNIDGLRDAVSDGESGLLVPADDVDALASGMRQLLDDDQLRQRLGQAGRERARRFDWDDIALEKEGLLQQALADIERADYQCPS